MKASGDEGGAASGRPSGSRSDEEDAVTTISTSVNIGKKPAPVTLSDAATIKVAELIAKEEGASGHGLPHQQPQRDPHMRLRLLL